jgi:NADPH-dependent glutamate synthase beta subunit-like oxidoreductase
MKLDKEIVQRRVDLMAEEGIVSLFIPVLSNAKVLP